MDPYRSVHSANPAESSDHPQLSLQGDSQQPPHMVAAHCRSTGERQGRIHVPDQHVSNEKPNWIYRSRSGLILKGLFNNWSKCNSGNPTLEISPRTNFGLFVT
ncbi:hypothetical protein CDAR_556541 [Caerostris darwini]|uniref:Uncharacterized protein n=1 Tax=Caerostris darwini TaxID=1538125 RepID=A0AAV4SB42_9ARAC|nr:hypothetical protein CDAR_556541 [Caerostris darwini]